MLINQFLLHGTILCFFISITQWFLIRKFCKFVVLYFSIFCLMKLRVFIWLNFVTFLRLHQLPLLSLLLVLLKYLYRPLLGPVLLFFLYFLLIFQPYLFGLERFQSFDRYFYNFLDVRSWFLCFGTSFRVEMRLLHFIFIMLTGQVNILMNFAFCMFHTRIID